MALAGPDLVEPIGSLTAELFPELDAAAFAARMTAYASQGNTEATAAGFTGSAVDAPARAWAYHRAYTAIFTRLNRDPASVSLSDQGSAAFLGAQLQAFRDMADASRAEFDAAVAALAADVTATPTAYPSIRSLRRSA